MKLLTPNSPTGKDYADEIGFDLKTVIAQADPLRVIQLALAEADWEDPCVKVARHLLADYTSQWPPREAAKLRAVKVQKQFAAAAEAADKYATAVFETAEAEFRQQPLWDCRRFAGHLRSNAQVAVLAAEAIRTDDERTRGEIALKAVFLVARSPSHGGQLLKVILEIIEEEKLLQRGLPEDCDEAIQVLWPEEWDKAYLPEASSWAAGDLRRRFEARKGRAHSRAA